MKLMASRRDEVLSKVIGEGLDRLATLDLHGRGIVAPIYEHARRKGGGAPLSYSFARALIESSSEGRAAVIATGFIIRKSMQPETDGMTGTAYLSHVLSKGLSAMPVVVCEDRATTVARAALEAAGLKVRDEAPAEGTFERGTCCLLGCPVSGDGASGSKEAWELARRQIRKLDPCLFLTIERPGMNAHGVPHTTFGASVLDISARMDDVLKDMASLKVPTFAVGDMGNELGMGAVSDLVGEITPYGRKCKCGCGGGVAAEAPANFTMMGSISDDACYAVGASIAQQLGIDELLPDDDMIRGILEAAVKAGAVDGLTNESSSSIDMVPWEEHVHIIRLMRATVTMAREHDSSRPQFIDHFAALAGW